MNKNPIDENAFREARLIAVSKPADAHGEWGIFGTFLDVYQDALTREQNPRQWNATILKLRYSAPGNLGDRLADVFEAFIPLLRNPRPAPQKSEVPVDERENCPWKCGPDNPRCLCVRKQSPDADDLAECVETLRRLHAENPHVLDWRDEDGLTIPVLNVLVALADQLERSDLRREL